MSKKKVSSKSLAENRKARYNYEIGETLECGLVLVGSEVKSLRDSGGLIAESYASIEEGELWLINCYICLLYTSPSPRDSASSRMPSSA